MTRRRREDGVWFGERDHAADLVLQLADVARPPAQQQVLHRVFGDAHVALAEFGGGLRDEVADERRNLVAPFAQRRDAQADDVEPVEQVLAEAPVLDLLFEVGVGRGDDADVDGERRGLAERADLAGLEEAQQLGLQVEAELADLVEKERAAARGADDARDGRGRRR